MVKPNGGCWPAQVANLEHLCVDSFLWPKKLLNCALGVGLSQVVSSVLGDREADSGRGRFLVSAGRMEVTAAAVTEKGVNVCSPNQGS